MGGVSGLGLNVLPSGSRAWVLRATMGIKRREMGLGGYPDVTLTGARQAAREAHEKIRAGIDPIEQKKSLRRDMQTAQSRSLTFRAGAEAYIAAHEAAWRAAKHRQQWAATLKTFAYPEIGNLQMSDITPSHIMAILDPIWRTKTETAKRLRGRIDRILDWATARGHREGLNPARWKGHLQAQLPAPSKVAKVKHHMALPLSDIGEFMKRLRSAEDLEIYALEVERRG